MYKIIKGSRTDINPAFTVALKQGSITGLPFDLTGLTAATCCFQNADQSDVSIALGSGLSVVGNPVLGTFLISLTAAQTALLAVISQQTLELTLTFSGDPIKIQIPNAYAVVTSIC